LFFMFYHYIIIDIYIPIYIPIYIRIYIRIYKIASHN
jgi:hypothetical protein